MRRARKNRYKDETPIVTSEGDIPGHFVRLSSVVARTEPRSATLLKALSDAHKLGTLPAVKLVRRISEMKVGPVFVDRSKAEEIIRQRVAEWASENSRVEPQEPEAAPAVETNWREQASAEVREKWAKSASDREVLIEAVLRLTERVERMETLVTTAIKRVENATESVKELSSVVDDLRAAAELRLEVDAAGSMVGSDAN